MAMNNEARCMCGTWVWGEPGVADVPYWGTASGPVRQRRAYCWGCHSELTIRDGQPVAEPMVPRKALAWLAVRADASHPDMRVQEEYSSATRSMLLIERIEAAIAAAREAVGDE